MIILVGFDWDDNNRDKNWLKHKVTNDECEEIFYNKPLVILQDDKHSKKERRLVAYGVTDTRRKLTMIFTIRNNRIRIISARDQSKIERITYENNKKNSEI